jgi:hypothetical protein
VLVPNVLLTVIAQAAPTTRDRPSLVLVIGTGLLALLAMVALWEIFKHSITIAHEGGHAVFASGTGGKVHSVKLERSGGGATRSADASKTAGVFVSLAGYLGPSLFGLLGALLLSQSKITAVLWLTLAFLVLMLLQIANFFGFLSVVATGVVVYLVTRYAPSGVQTVFAYTWIWFLLMGGTKAVVELQAARTTARKAGKPDKESDAFQLRESTKVPAPLWVGFFFLATLAALFFGGAILLGMVLEPGLVPAPAGSPSPSTR